MERTVVSTPSGCAGLELEHMESAWIASGARAFADGVIALLADATLRRRLAERARKIAEDHFDWKAIGKDILKRPYITIGMTAFVLLIPLAVTSTNAMLRRRSEGVARNSLHMKAMAIDLQVPDRSLRAVHLAAVSLKRGGVGYYLASDFVHVDTGNIRYW